MNMETYEETRLRRDDSWARYMVEGMDVSLLTWNGKVGQRFSTLRACCLWQDRVMEGALRPQVQLLAWDSKGQAASVCFANRCKHAMPSMLLLDMAMR